MANTGPQRYCQQVDLENAVGGPTVLVQLLDKNGDGVADPLLVNDALDAGCADIAAKIERIVALGGISEPYPTQLVKQSARACAFYAWGIGSDGQAIPAHVQALYDNAMRWAERVGDRQDGLGESPRPDLSPPSRIIDPDPCGRGVSVAGFKKGFR